LRPGEYRQGAGGPDYSLTGVGVGTIAVKSFSGQPWTRLRPSSVISTCHGGVRGNAVVVGTRV